MACPTCGHTVQNLGIEGRRVFWCPRCGTLVADSGEGTFASVDVPRWARLARAGNADELVREAQNAAIAVQWEQRQREGEG